LDIDDRVICEVADRLLLRVDLGQLLPEPAGQWLQAYGAKIHLSTRVSQIKKAENGFAIDGETFAAAIIASAPQHVGALWPPAATDHTYEPIATDYPPDCRTTDPRVILAGDYSWAD
jgi:predicted NAD/FAD-binding protein